MTILTQVYQATSSDALHVIFVHGLGGDALELTRFRGHIDVLVLGPSFMLLLGSYPTWVRLPKEAEVLPSGTLPGDVRARS